MRSWLQDLLVSHWQRKLVSFITAIVVWFSVYHSITTTVVIPDIRVRVVNLPQDKTMKGLHSSGLLRQRVTLTITGRKSVLSEIDSNDLEIVIDATNRGEEWVAEVGKKNLKTLNPDLDLASNMTQVSRTEILMKLSNLITAKVPVTIAPPHGELPKGYQYLDVWPQQFLHTISGPEEEVEELQQKGLEISFDLSQITKEELDRLVSLNPELLPDEVSYPVPSKWKRVAIPFHNNATEEINDPDTRYLRIEFLRKELLPLDREIPIRVFFSLKYSQTLNPATYQLAINDLIVKKNGITVLTLPLYVRDVSRLFLDVVRDNLDIVVQAVPRTERSTLQWSVVFINAEEMENRYVSLLMRDTIEDDDPEWRILEREKYLRNRFREYMRAFQLVVEELPLKLQVKLQGNTILVEQTPAPVLATP